MKALYFIYFLLIACASQLEPCISTAQCADSVSGSLGNVIELGDTCAAGLTLLPNTSCMQLRVECPGLAPIEAEIRITAPDAKVASRGTVIFSSGGSGTGYYGSGVGPLSLFKDLAALGFRVIDRVWNNPTGWTSSEGGLKLESCRYATLIKWIHGNIHTGGAFVVSGNSGGSAEVGYALSTWGLGSIVDLAVPTSGPAVARLDFACQSPASQQWSDMADTIIPAGAMTCTPSPINLSTGDGVCHQCSGSPGPNDWLNDGVVHPGAMLNYPKTRVHFIFGANDCDGPPVPVGLTYADAITSDCTVEFAANTPHLIPGTTEGRAAILNAIDKLSQPASGIDDQGIRPVEAGSVSIVQLGQNYPNPAPGATMIEYSIPSTQYVALRLYDLTSRQVAVIREGVATAGRHVAVFNAAGLPPGTYYYVLQTASACCSRIMTVLDDN